MNAQGQAAPGGTATATQPAPRRKTILVVEDNATVGGLIVGLLREEGYRALRAWDSREALRMARDRRPDLIMLDLSLPYNDGLGMLHHLKAQPETSEAPIMVVSGNTLLLSPEDQEQIVEAINKPADIFRLVNSVRRALGEPEVEVPERHYDTADLHLNSY